MWSSITICRSSFDYCTYCDDADYEASLHAPIRTLPPRLSTSTCGTPSITLAPKTTSCISCHECSNSLPPHRCHLPTLEMVIGRLALAHWQQWPVKQRRAMQRVLNAMWDETMAQHPAPLDPDSLLCGLGIAGYDLDTLFDAWLRDSRLTSRLQIGEVIFCNARELPRNHLGNAWWGQAPDVRAKVISWHGS